LLQYKEQILCLLSLLVEKTKSERGYTTAPSRPRAGPSTGLSILHATNVYASALLPHLRGTPGNNMVPMPGQVLATHAAVPSCLLTTASWGNEGPIVAATSSLPPLHLGWDGM
ncbi:hypothetical protein H0H92_014157, partial [Tricholoma furcatifolium]